MDRTLRDLGLAAARGEQDGVAVVFCELRSNESAFALARYTNIASRRVLPVLLADFPDAPWSFTVQPRRPYGGTLQQVAG